MKNNFDEFIKKHPRVFIGGCILLIIGTFVFLLFSGGSDVEKPQYTNDQGNWGKEENYGDIDKIPVNTDTETTTSISTDISSDMNILGNVNDLLSRETTASYPANAAESDVNFDNTNPDAPMKLGQTDNVVLKLNDFSVEIPFKEILERSDLSCFVEDKDCCKNTIALLPSSEADVQKKIDERCQKYKTDNAGEITNQVLSGENFAKNGQKTIKLCSIKYKPDKNTDTYRYMYYLTAPLSDNVTYYAEMDMCSAAINNNQFVPYVSFVLK